MPTTTRHMQVLEEYLNGSEMPLYEVLWVCEQAHHILDGNMQGQKFTKPAESQGMGMSLTELAESFEDYKLRLLATELTIPQVMNIMRGGPEYEREIGIDEMFKLEGRQGSMERWEAEMFAKLRGAK